MQRMAAVSSLLLLLAAAAAAAAATATAAAAARLSSAASEAVRPVCTMSETGALHCTIETRSTITVGPGAIPEAAVSLTVRGPSRLTLATNATLRLARLRSVTVQQVGRLAVAPHALRPPPTDTLLSVAVTGVGQVQLEQEALYGIWSDGARLSLTNISLLEVAGGALKAPLAAVSLHSVSMPVCESGTFWSGVGQLSVTSSRLGRLQPHCLQLAAGGQLQLHDTRVADLQSRAVSGRLLRLTISGGSLGTVSTRAVQGHVRELRLERCSVHTLHAAAVDAAVDQASLVKVRLGEVAGGALAGLRHTTRLLIDTVSVATVQPRALLLNDTVRQDGLHVTRLYLDGLACDCDMAAAARRLAGADGPRPGATSAALAGQLLTAAYCATAGQPQVLARLSETRCGPPPAEETAAGGPVARPPLQAAGGGDQTAVFYVVVGGVTALLAALLYLAVHHRRRIAALLSLLGCRLPARRRTSRWPAYSTQSSQNSGVQLVSGTTGGRSAAGNQ